MTGGAVGVDDVVAQRFRTQRLTSAGLADPADVVRLLTCVQAQDAPLSRFSIGMRTTSANDDDVRAAIDGGRILRTHILRPTWHYVLPEDLRWILALTSPKVEAGLAARHRQLGLDVAVIERVHGAFVELLGGRQCRTRREIDAELVAAGMSYRGEQLGHLLLVAELRGLLCSGPLPGACHTYGLVDELVPPSPARDRDDAVRDLVLRFFAGHGPAAVGDLQRWTKLLRAEIDPALEDLRDRLETVVVDGTTLWFDPSADVAEHEPARAFLLPVFDEAYLTYPKLNMPRADGHASGDAPPRFGEAGGGVVVLDRRDVGTWKRRARGGVVEIGIELASSVRARDRAVVVEAANRLASFIDRAPDIRFVR